MGSLLSCVSRQSTNKQSSSTTQRCADTDTSKPIDFSSLSCDPEPAAESANTQSSDRVAAFKTQKPVYIDTSDPPDFSIIVDEETIPVHRNLREETCDYFHCLFECGIQEVETGKLEVNHIKASVVRTVISYLYGKVISIELDNVTDYTDIAEMWQLLQLKDELEDYIVTNIDADINNCIPWHWVDFAENYNMEKLERKIQNLDACIKLRVCFSSIHDDNAAVSKHVNLLHRFKLTECSPGFIEVALKKTFSDAELEAVQMYADLLLTKCTINALETIDEEQTFSDFHVSIGNRHEAGKERHTMSSAATGKEPEGQGDGHMTQNSRGELSNRQKIIVLRNDQMLYSFDFNADLSEVHLTEVGRHPHGNAHNCMTPYGMFSIGVSARDHKYDCMLFDISSLNYIHLPALAISPRLHPVSVNATVYVLNPSQGKVACLDLQKPTHWHISDHDWGHSKFCPHAYAIGSKIYLIDITDKRNIRMVCFDTTSQTQSKCKSYTNVWDYKNIKVLATDQSILVLYNEVYEINKTSDEYDIVYTAEYNTLYERWTTRTTLDVTDTDASICNTEVRCPGSASGVPRCLIVTISSLGTLSVYDMYDSKPIRSLPIPWDSKYKITNTWKAR